MGRNVSLNGGRGEKRIRPYNEETKKGGEGRDARLTSWAYARHDLEVDEVDVDGVGPGGAEVAQLPLLDGAAGWFGEDAIRDVVEGDVVDGPVAGRVSLEDEGVVDGGVFAGGV